jgi:oxygen-independent coproporphyrinogen-3 oxidase
MSERPRHLYVHVPFCGRRCSYCDFAIAVRRVVPVEQYLESVELELERRYPGPPSTWTLDTLYLGGGTPSRLGADGVARLVDGVARRASLASAAEVTVEANPDDVTPAAVARWTAAGVNRLSLGVQSFDDDVLRWMHRTHDAATIGRAVDTARDGGLTNFSVDLIFAVPGEVSRDWARDLDAALALEPPHMSVYGLTVEQGTPLARWRARGAITEADEARYEAEFLATDAALRAAGFDHYEVSNYAGSGGPSRHNGAYWRNVPYAAVGPASHEFDGQRRRWNVAQYTDWQRRLAAGEDPVEESEELTPENRTAEQVYLGLRTSSGLKLRPGEEPTVARWVEAGWGAVTDGRLVLTAIGWLRLDSLAASLTSLRSR